MSDLGQSLYAMAEQLIALENRLKTLEEGKTKVAFSALIETGGAYGPFKTDVTLAFNKVLTNIGGAYDSSTGVFTAPVTGVYHFSFFYHAGGKHKARLTLFKNDKKIVKSSNHQTGSNTADNGGNAVVLQLQQGDKVYVSMPENHHVWATSISTSFSGFLLS
ncbi:complement C1q subcomponent subunit C-like [Sparus aurata]|uniref:complement C1q subcomponent subunit C-like n=1 Tax=Sparus aurata TaxID=8175 RepID=UPI0011C1A394|nr:complement C1q subcomponent subunit C-like [Sparus aurata]